MALQNYRERKIGHHVVLITTEEDIGTILLGVPGAIVDFEIGTKQLWHNGASVFRESENTYILRGYELWQDVDGMHLPADLLVLSEYILENDLYDSMSFRHEEIDLEKTILS